MNILILCHSFLNNGKEANEITITRLAKELEPQHHVTIIAESGIRKTIQKIRQVNFKPDVIHGFSAAPLMVLKVFVVKILLNRHARTIQTLKSYSKKLLGSLLFSPLLNVVDAVTVSTKEYQQNLIRHGCKGKKIQVIRSYVDTKKFIPLNKIALKKKYGFTGKKIIFYYGSFYPTKGVPELLQAIKPMLSENTIALLCPRHEVDEEIKEQVKLLGIENKVHFALNVNIVEYLNMADVLVLPYISMSGTEGNPSCLLEAAACKIPIVTSHFPELEEIMIPEEDVLMATPGDVRELGQQIHRVLNDAKLSHKLTENAYKKVQQFAVERVIPRIVALYSTADPTRPSYTRHRSDNSDQ